MPNNEAGNYEFQLDAPNVAMAPNGDTFAATGGPVQRPPEVGGPRRNVYIRTG